MLFDPRVSVKFKSNKLLLGLGKLVVAMKPPLGIQVVIFGDGGADFLGRAVLHEIEHVIINPRTVNFLSLGVIRFFFNYFYLIFTDSEGHGLLGRIYRCLGNVRRLWLYACLREINPKVVITYVDNDYDFQWMCSYYKSAEFIAIQNGVREKYDLSKWLPNYPHPARRVRLSQFYCFGDFEVDLYPQYDHHVENFHPVGSLRASYFQEKYAMTVSEDYSSAICLVSQWVTASDMKNCLWPEFYESFSKLCIYLRKYIEQNECSLTVALRGRTQEEQDYYRDKLGSLPRLIRNDPATMESYRAVNSAEVILTANSTLGREAFSCGKRVLFCNCSKDSNYDFPNHGIWSLSHPSYEEFSDRLSKLRGISDQEFIKLSQSDAQYVMRNPRTSGATKQLREHIVRVLV